MLAHGVDHNDFVRVTADLADWSAWHDAWVAAGDVHRDLGDDAERRGRLRTAGESFVRAAVYYHFAKFLWLDDLEKYRGTMDRAVATLRHGAAMLDSTFERIEIPFEGGQLVANLRRPPGVTGTPAVVLVPGLDSTKEEFPAWEETFLRRGIATLSFDGPGQGEAGYALAIRPDYEVAVTALLDVLARRTDIDASRVGISGVGLGNYYAARAAAFEPRIKAVGVIGGPYTFKPGGERTLRKFMHSARIDDEATAREYAKVFTLAGVTARIAQPYLVIHGRLDHSFPWQDAERKAKEAPRGELVVFPDGGGVCYSVDYKAKPLLADWMREKLSAGV